MVSCSGVGAAVCLFRNLTGGLAAEYLGYLKSCGPLLFAVLMIRADSC